jgi:small ligand-binding sensory domain FIST
MRIATGTCADLDGAEAFGEAAARAGAGLGNGGAELAIVFAGRDHLEDAEAGMAAVRERIGAEAVVGCGAQGVVGGGREFERGGVTVWAASLPDAEVTPFRLDVTPAGDAGVAVTGLPDLEGADVAVLLADPYSFPVEPLLGKLSDDAPGVPIVGGLASAGPGAPALLDGTGAVATGALGVALRGVDVRPCVSQGARPIGPEMAITDADGSVVHELAGRPALERLREAIAALDPSEQELAARGLLLGIVIDPNKPDYERGDFLIRGIVGIDEDEGTITVGAQARVGQTVRLQVRDAESAHEDLEHALDRQLDALPRAPAGALLFTCNGRGSHMFGTPHHDARAVADAFAGAPTAGFFCAGEIGPVGDRNFVHGFTATLAIFAA